MRDTTNTQLLDLLETAHGYAVAGSIMPFKSACVACNLQGSTTAKTAADLIDKAREELSLPTKPAKERYAEAICLALERVEKGVWP